MRVNHGRHQGDGLRYGWINRRFKNGERQIWLSYFGLRKCRELR